MLRDANLVQNQAFGTKLAKSSDGWMEIALVRRMLSTNNLWKLYKNQTHQKDKVSITGFMLYPRHSCKMIQFKIKAFVCTVTEYLSYLILFLWKIKLF